LLNFTAKTVILKPIETICFRTESPDHISSWKQFCKTQMSLFHTLSIFRQLTGAIAHLNAHGIIHRDVHPTRLHIHNGLLKFNTIGLPYNFKKLLKNPNYSGHVSYSAPELINENSDFSYNSDTWSLGCCLYYLVTK
jgi:serine/threonine protein kinase